MQMLENGILNLTEIMKELLRSVQTDFYSEARTTTNSIIYFVSLANEISIAVNIELAMGNIVGVVTLTCYVLSRIVLVIESIFNNM